MDGRGKLCVVRLEGAGIVGDSAVPQADDAGSILLCKLRIMCNHNHQSVFRYFLKKIHDLHTCITVQCTCRFICKQDIRIIH